MEKLLENKWKKMNPVQKTAMLVSVGGSRKNAKLMLGDMSYVIVARLLDKYPHLDVKH